MGYLQAVANLLFCVGVLSSLFIYVSGEVSSFETEVIKLIKEYGHKIPEDCFLTDPIFVQKKDRATSEIRYTLPNGKEFEYVTTRNDTNREIVVFTSEEDELLFKKRKRVYVALKKNSSPNDKRNPEYFAAAVYIRDAGDKDADPIDIEGRKYKIEWSLWDEHLVPGGTTLVVNSMFCASSLIVPCLFSDDPIKAGNGIVQPPQRYIPKKTFFQETKEISADHFVVAGGDPDDLYDLYRDLESERNMEGRAVEGGDATHEGHPGVVGILDAGHLNALCAALGAKAGKLCGQRRKRSGEFSTALDFPGWKTQYIKAVKGSYAVAHEENPYFGFGNCPAKPWKPSDLDNVKDAEGAVDFYLVVLRTDCVGVIKGQLDKLMELNVLRFKAEDKTFHLDIEYTKAKNPKLNFHESVLGVTGAGMHLFSQALVHLIKSPIDKPESPDGKRITRSTNTNIDLVLKLLDQSRNIYRLHMTAATRNAIVAARMCLSKLAQDKQNIENQCTDCDDDLAINYNDRLAIMTLLQFLKYGTHEFDTKASVGVHDSYIQFYKANIKINELKVDMFT